VAARHREGIDPRRWRSLILRLRGKARVSALLLLAAVLVPAATLVAQTAPASGEEIVIINQATARWNDMNGAPGGAAAAEVSIVADMVAPAVGSIITVPWGEPVRSGSLLTGDVGGLTIAFSEPLRHGVAGSVSSPASYLLAGAGTGGSVRTQSCGALASGDVAIPIAAVHYDAATSTATVQFGAALPAGEYRFILCSSGLHDLAGNPLAGGVDQVIGFQVVPAAQIPTLGFYGLIILALLFALLGLFGMPAPRQ
jgi:hypothetical protein